MAKEDRARPERAPNFRHASRAQRAPQRRARALRVKRARRALLDHPPALRVHRAPPNIFARCALNDSTPFGLLSSDCTSAICSLSTVGSTSVVLYVLTRYFAYVLLSMPSVANSAKQRSIVHGSSRDDDGSGVSGISACAEIGRASCREREL